MIELLCPSKGRPEKMRRMWDSARQTAHNPGNLFLRLGVNAEETALYKPHQHGAAAMYSVPDWSTAFTLNILSREAMRDGMADLFMIIADDAIFSTPEWDRALLEHYSALENKAHVYSFLDSRSADGTPHPIATRAWIDAMGYFACPIFLHWYVDTWMVEIAKANGCFTHLKDYLLIHDKPSDSGQPDATHTSIRQRGWHERDSFVNKTCQHFLETEKERLKLVLQQASGTREHLD